MIATTDKLSEILQIAPELSPLFERYGIGSIASDTSIYSQAKTLGLDAAFLVELANASFEPSRAPSRVFRKYTVPVLVDYLKRSHDYYLCKKLPEIGQSIHALRSILSADHPVYILLSGFFVCYRKELETHFEYEEAHLFPYARLLDSAQSTWRALPNLEDYLKSYSVQQFLDNHTDTEVELQNVREALLNYRAPSGSQLPYQVLLKQLASFENDMHLHALIEDQVLIPKLAALELEMEKNKSENA